MNPDNHIYLYLSSRNYNALLKYLLDMDIIGKRYHQSGDIPMKSYKPLPPALFSSFPAPGYHSNQIGTNTLICHVENWKKFMRGLVDEF